jgi:hypothetical protein
MSGWMAAGWFSLWPTTDWAFFLLSSFNLGATFFLLFLAMRISLGAQGALVAVVLTSMISLFGPDCGFRFNANTALLPWLAGFAWALSAAAELNGSEDNQWSTAYSRYFWLVSAGMFAAAAFLTKYFAAVVLFAFFVSFHGVRTSPKRLVSDGLVIGVTALLLISPHLAWGVTNHWPALAYARESHKAVGVIECVQEGVQSILCFFGFLALPTLVWLGSCRWAKSKHRQPEPAPIHEDAVLNTPRRNYRYSATAAFILCLVLTLASSLIATLKLEPKWFTPVGLFLGWTLLEATPLKVRRQLLVPIVFAAMVQWFLGLAYAGFQHHQNALTELDKVALRPLIAHDAGSRFSAAYGQPLRYVAGSVPLAYATSFYAPSHPLAIVNTDFQRSVWIDKEKVAVDGLAVLCDTQDAPSAKEAEAVLGLPDKKVTLSYRNGAQVDLLLYRPLLIRKRPAYWKMEKLGISRPVLRARPLAHARARRRAIVDTFSPCYRPHPFHPIRKSLLVINLRHKVPKHASPARPLLQSHADKDGNNDEFNSSYCNGCGAGFLGGCRCIDCHDLDHAAHGGHPSQFRVEVARARVVVQGVYHGGFTPDRRCTVQFPGATGSAHGPLWDSKLHSTHVRGRGRAPGRSLLLSDHRTVRAAQFDGRSLPRSRRGT